MSSDIVPSENINLRMAQAKQTYLEAIDISEPPDFYDLADRYGLKVPDLRRIAREESWERQRLMLRGEYERDIAIATKNELANAALNIGKIRSDLFAKSYAILFTTLDKVHDELNSRIGIMDSKTLVSYLKLLIDLSDRMQKMIDETSRETKEEIEQEESFWDKFGKTADVITVIKKRDNIDDSQVDELIEENAERAEAFGKLSRSG